MKWHRVNKNTEELRIKRNELQRLARRSQSERQRHRHHKYRYGLAPEDYIEMLKNQNNKCFTCGKIGGETKGSKLHIDHNHNTNEVRKLLCNRCNYIAGAIEDRRYKAVLQYLEDHNGWSK